VALALLAGFAALAAGCGGSTDTQSTTTTTVTATQSTTTTTASDTQSTTTPTARPVGVKFAVGNKIKAGVPRAELIRRVGDPVLSSKAVNGSPGGCLYFAMYQRPLADVWAFCLDEHDKVNAGVTLYSPQQPPPPPDASVARKVLIARADAICGGTTAKTGSPEKLVQQVRQVTASSSSAARRKLAALMRTFAGSTEATRRQLKRFNAPPDELSELEAYQNALHDQAVALDRAANALSAGDQKDYRQQLGRARDLGQAATDHARQYGFSKCAGVKVS
jgi:hypothetical protein